MTDITVREARVRRALAKKGLRLVKTPARSWLREQFGPGYMILDGNFVVLGCGARQYEATLEEIESAAFATAA